MKNITQSKTVSKRNYVFLRYLLPFLFIIFAVNGLNAQAVGDYGTNSSAAWSTTSNWLVCTTPAHG